MEGGKQISEAADAPAYRRGKRKIDQAGRDRRNLRFRVHAAVVLWRQAIIARTDDQTIRELRRLGGLLKHHFDVVKRTGNTATLAELDAGLREVRRAIEALSERR